MTYYRKIILILLGLLMSMQAHSGAESGIVTATVVDTEAISGLSTIQVNSAKALGTNTFSNFESAVKDYQTIQNSINSVDEQNGDLLNKQVKYFTLGSADSDIDTKLNNLAKASEVIAVYAVAYLVSVVDPLLEEYEKSGNAAAQSNDNNDVRGLNKENRIFNEATTKVMDALKKIDNKSSLSSINAFVDTNTFKEKGALLGPNGKLVSGCKSLFCDVAAAIATRKSQAKGNVVDPYKFTIKLFEESKQLSKIMAPANKRKIYKTNARGGIGEYGGANVLNTLRQSKAATEIRLPGTDPGTQQQEHHE